MLEIYQKSDIIVPFEKIGENGWQEKTKIILEALADNWGNELPKPKTNEEITELEKRLNTALPNGLRLFYQTFGIADIGEELMRFSDIGRTNDIWFKNGEYIEYAPDFNEEDKAVLPYLVHFSDYLGNGNMFCFHSQTHEIYYYDHESGAPYFTKLFDTADDYIKACLIHCQANLFGENIDEDEVMRWTEEITAEIFGKEVIRKWRY